MHAKDGKPNSLTRLVSGGTNMIVFWKNGDLLKRERKIRVGTMSSVSITLV
jgi:hypothetical protein